MDDKRFPHIEDIADEYSDLLYSHDLLERVWIYVSDGEKDLPDKLMGELEEFFDG